LATLVAAQSRYRPLYYNLADEAGIGDLAAAWDADISPVSLAALRDWLHTQYPSLGALNAEWGTNFPNWESVQPMLTDAALARNDGNYAAWGDFKQFMDIAFARAVRAGTDALHRADASALAGLEGGQLPGWGGYDYFQLAPAVDVLEIYDEANNVAVARAASPSTTILRTSFGPGDGAEAWRNLLQGGRGTVVWDEGDQVVRADGSPLPRGTELARLTSEIRAVAPTMLAAQPERDQVAVLVSQSSFRVQWLLDRRGGAPWSDRDSGREYEDNAWRASRRETLQRLSALGVQPFLLSSAMLEAGALAREGIRVLFLPDAVSLSDAEIAAVRAFTAAGGTVLADTEPGLFDGHGRRRDALPLVDIAKVSEAVMRRGGSADAPQLDAIADLLKSAGTPPRADFRAPDGSRAAGIEARWFRHDATLLLSLQAAAPYATADRIAVTLRNPASIRNLRLSGPALSTQSFNVALDGTEPTILELTGR
ncbi:MAG: beta-galactosidase, partial [Pseudomonadota bacterium]|nr:beta-galactosidase [Pseudomonadota bacterium]